MSALLRAMQDNLDAWVSDGIAPPPSAVPRRDAGTLCAVDEVRAAFPAIPGAVVPHGVNHLFVEDRGGSYAEGISTVEPPVEDRHREYRQFVPAVDVDGNDVAGIRGPDLVAPIATYTGWNYQLAGQAEKALAAVYGSYLPFPMTEAERARTGDPRVSLEARYPSHEAYVEAVRAAARQLVKQRLLLDEDAEQFVARAADRAPSWSAASSAD